MTRAMLMTVLARLDGQNVEGGNPWYQKSMDWARRAGVSDGTMPEEDVTREQLVTMLYRYAVYSGADVTAPEKQEQYLDWDSVAGWAADAFAWAVDRGIINGTSPKELSPGGNALRCMAAAIFQRYCELLQ